MKDLSPKVESKPLRIVMVSGLMVDILALQPRKIP
jgi:hypothetical protein